MTILKASHRLLADERYSTTSNIGSIFALPPGHNMDDGELDVGLDDEDPNPGEDAPMLPTLNAALRLARK